MSPTRLAVSHPFFVNLRLFPYQPLASGRAMIFARFTIVGDPWPFLSEMGVHSRAF